MYSENRSKRQLHLSQAFGDGPALIVTYSLRIVTWHYCILQSLTSNITTRTVASPCTQLSICINRKTSASLPWVCIRVEWTESL